jgi:hypothetical protein
MRIMRIDVCGITGEMPKSGGRVLRQDKMCQIGSCAYARGVFLCFECGKFRVKLQRGGK